MYLGERDINSSRAGRGEGANLAVWDDPFGPYVQRVHAKAISAS